MTHAINPERIKIGPADIWVGVTPPADGVAMNHTAGEPADGTYVGMTEGPATFIYTPTYVEEEAEQALSTVEAFVIHEAGTLEFQMKEFAANALATALQNAKEVADETGDPHHDEFFVGGHQETRNGPAGAGQRSIFLITPQIGLFTAGGVQLYTYLTVYRAINIEPFTSVFDKKKGTLLKVKFNAMADVTRSVGDQLFQLIRERTVGGS